MNNIPPPTGIKDASGPAQAKTRVGAYLAKVKEYIPPNIRSFLLKFYSNKKIFLPFAIVFGLMFLVIILGVLFGNKGGPGIPVGKSTPTPFIQATAAPCSESDTLCLTRNKLMNLENQINSVDPKQSRISPPNIDYDISF